MRIAVWKTGHEIADRVAQSLAEGFNGEVKHCHEWDAWKKYGIPNREICHIAYGILRGASEIFRNCDTHWFNVDRGYTNPSHFNGSYRISYRGTQFKWHENIPRKPIDTKLEPWRTKGDYVLICPPTQAVCDFFGRDRLTWEAETALKCYKACMPARWRHKGSVNPIEGDLANAKAVITFNSSVGWKALQMGIPVLSDPTHSAIGSFYNCPDLQSLTDKLQNMPDNRLQLFEAMAAHQFTLAEIEQGKAWPILEHYLSMCSSDLMTGKPSPQMSHPIASSAAPNQMLKSTFSNIGN